MPPIPEQYTASAAGSALQVPAPPLTTLEGDLYDRQKFYNLNDNSFTELVSSIEGIGVQEFFTLYQDLKSTIPVGSADLIVSVGDSLFNDILATVQSIGVAINQPSGADLTGLTEHLNTLVSQISQLNNFVVVANGDSSSLSFLVADALTLIPSLNDKFKRLFDYIISILTSNADLTNQNAILQAKIATLTAQIGQLTLTISKLTSTDVGFHSEPDLFSTVSNPLIVPGVTVQLVVCGSSNYTFDVPAEFQNVFTISPMTPSPKHTVYTNVRFGGNYAYFSIVNNDPTTGLGLSDTVFFEFPTKSVIGGAQTLITNIQNNNILMYVLDPASFDGFEPEDPETTSINKQFAALPHQIEVVVSPTTQANGSPFRVIPDPNIGSGPNDIFADDFDIVRNGFKNPAPDGTLHFFVIPKSTISATENHAITVTDVNGLQAIFSVEVQAVKLTPIAAPTPLSISTTKLTVSIGTTDTVVVSGGVNGVYKVSGPTNATIQAISDVKSPPGPVTYQITGKSVGQGTYTFTNVPSGDYVQLIVNVSNA